MQSVNIKTTEPISTMGKILQRYEIIIKAISISNAWNALYLMKYGTFGLRANPANNIMNNKKLPKGKDFSIIVTGKVKNNSIFKKEYLLSK